MDICMTKLFVVKYETIATHEEISTLQESCKQMCWHATVNVPTKWKTREKNGVKKMK